MNATRLTTGVVFVSSVAGVSLLALADSPLIVVVGSVLLVASALAIARHFWREGEKRATRESRKSAAALRSYLSDLGQSDLDDAVSAVNKRVDLFTRGVLEYMAQLEIDLNHLSRDLVRRLENGDVRAARHRDEVLKQLSGVIGVYATLEPRVPYPTFGGWAIGGDCAQRLVALILKNRPRWVIEAGSGLSTVLAAQALELLGEGGMVIALEHDKEWLEETTSLLSDHGVSGSARVLHAPLVDTPVEDEVFRWYDLTGLPLPDQAQLVFIDGPPKATGPMARYPAIPLLYDRMSQGCVLLMDDADRDDEKRAIDRWASEYPDLKMRRYSDSKGTVEVTKGNA